MNQRLLKKGIFVIIGAVAFCFSYAQPMRQSSPEDLESFGYEKLEEGDYVNAASFLQQAYDLTDKMQLAYDIARSYELMRDYRQAELWYKRVFRKDKENNFPFARYNHGRMMKASAKYEEAKEEFYAVLTATENDSLKTLVRNELLGISLALTGEDPVDISIRNAGSTINSAFSEYSPSLAPDGTLYFGGYNRKEMIILDGSEEDYHAKIYTGKLEKEEEETEDDNSSSNNRRRRQRRSTKAKKGKGTQVTPLGKHINREDYHTSNVSISDDGKRMYFTRQQLNSNQVQESIIYLSVNDGGQWLAPDPIAKVNGDYLATHPIEGELFGQRVLYFASDMPGGYGGYDLYYSTINGDDYSLPVNLGKVINTSGNEITPYYNAGRLYFSSDYLPSLGGYDIFSSEWNGAEWDAPANLGKGYNSSMDDTYFRIDETGYEGFLVSNRPGTMAVTGKKTCCDDIYVLSKKKIIIDLLAGTVNSKNEALTGATLKLVDITNGPGESKVQYKERDYLFNFPLNADRTYKVVASKSGFKSDSTTFNTDGIVETTRIEKKLTLNALPKEKEKDETVVTKNQTIRLSNIYYDYDDDKILKDAEKDLNVLYGLLEEYPTMIIELSSHTDSRGPDAYNEDLSRRRAQSAKQWLVNKGINADRIEARGYGEKFILNQCTEGVECTDDEHRYNRRTEFKVIAGPEEIRIKSQAKNVPGRSSGGNSVPIENEIELKGPIMKFDEKSVDLGKIKYGESKSYTFTFTNVGDQALSIEHASACTCTSVDYPVLEIAPGDQGEIKIVYDSTKKEGKEAYGAQEVLVEMITNTPNRFEDVMFTITVEE